MSTQEVWRLLREVCTCLRTFSCFRPAERDQTMIRYKAGASNYHNCIHWLIPSSVKCLAFSSPANAPLKASGMFYHVHDIKCNSRYNLLMHAAKYTYGFWISHHACCHLNSWCLLWYTSFRMQMWWCKLQQWCESMHSYMALPFLSQGLTLVAITWGNRT